MTSPSFFTQPTGVSNEPDIKKPVRDKQDIRDTISRRLNDENRYGIISGWHAESSTLTMPMAVRIAGLLVRASLHQPIPNQQKYYSFYWFTSKVQF